MDQVKIAALQTAAQSEYLALSREDQQRVNADFCGADCSAIEYMRRIGAGNLQAYADCLAAGERRRAKVQS